MNIGDLLEWAGATCLVAAAYLFFHTVDMATALVVAGICLAYLAQCYADRPLAVGRGLVAVRRYRARRAAAKAAEG